MTNKNEHFLYGECFFLLKYFAEQVKNRTFEVLFQKPKY